MSCKCSSSISPTVLEAVGVRIHVTRFAATVTRLGRVHVLLPNLGTNSSWSRSLTRRERERAKNKLESTTPATQCCQSTIPVRYGESHGEDGFEGKAEICLADVARESSSTLEFVILLGPAKSNGWGQARWARGSPTVPHTVIQSSQRVMLDYLVPRLMLPMIDCS